ncbi:hypothetical protein ABFX02_09G062100 [Erythranthe guttata]
MLMQLLNMEGASSSAPPRFYGTSPPSDSTDSSPSDSAASSPCDSTVSSPPDATDTAADSTDGPSKFLADLPSRGFFSSPVVSSNPEEMPVYICDHDTSPPDDQLIKTNQTHILVRSLMLKNQKDDPGSKDAKVAPVNQVSRKRPAEKPLDKAEGKKPMSRAQLDALPDLAYSRRRERKPRPFFPPAMRFGGIIPWTLDKLADF